MNGLITSHYEVEVEELDEIPINLEQPDQVINFGSQLDLEVCSKLVDFLVANKDCFTWLHIDMAEIDPEVICHKLTLTRITNQSDKREEK